MVCLTAGDGSRRLETIKNFEMSSICWIRCIYCSSSFVNVKAHKTQCALLASKTWLHTGPWVYIDDCYPKARPLSLGTSIAAGIHSHSLLCHTAGISAVAYSRHVCCVAQQTRLLCDTADMSAAPHSRRVCFVAQQACLLRQAADTSAVYATDM